MATEQRRTLQPDHMLFFEYVMLTDQIKPLVEHLGGKLGEASNPT